MGSLSHDQDELCPDSLGSSWDVSDGQDGWLEDTTLSVSCA